MTVPDPIAAVVSLLAADADVAALVGTTTIRGTVVARVFGEEVPAEEAVNMPRAAITVSAGGGFHVRSYVQLQTPRLDVKCYGQTLSEAGALHQAAYNALKYLNRSVQGVAFLHNAIQVGGPISLRDDDTEWPFVFSSWEVLASDLAVS